MRGEPRHHLSSKVLCWVALDRAVELAPQLGMHARVEEWAAERDEIRAAILEHGWSEARQAYAQSFGSDELDGAQLLMPIYGFLPATDPRMRSTIEAIARDLTEDGLVLRYRAEEGLNADGLTGEEGTFVICSFWLVSCLAQAGEVERAEALFEQLAGYANDLGLLGEEIDTANGEQLGNFPQAYSHIGLITAAYEIDKAQARHDRLRRRSCVGGGPAGEHCAARLADGGLRVAIAERELLGGECSYWGCIPSKTLLRPGEALHAAREAPGALRGQTPRGQTASRRGQTPRGQTAWGRGLSPLRHARRGQTPLGVRPLSWTPRRRLRGAISWSPATTTPARRAGLRARASRCCAAPPGSTAPGG